MANINNAEGSNYAVKMDRLMSNAMKEWWNSLSKDEILQYLHDQPAVTADNLRRMLADVDTVLAFDVRFSTDESAAATDFHTNQ